MLPHLNTSHPHQILKLAAQREGEKEEWERVLSESAIYREAKEMVVFSYEDYHVIKRIRGLLQLIPSLEDKVNDTVQCLTIFYYHAIRKLVKGYETRLKITLYKIDIN